MERQLLLKVNPAKSPLPVPQRGVTKSDTVPAGCEAQLGFLLLMLQPRWVRVAAPGNGVYFWFAIFTVFLCLFCALAL